MKKLSLLTILLTVGEVLVAQPFVSEKIYQSSKPDSIHLEWGDLSGDGLLDIVVFSQDQGKTTAFTMIQHDSLTFHREELILDTLAQLNFQLKDFDHDGKLDIIYKTQGEAGNLTIALNTGNLTFDLIKLDFPVDEFLINDIDHDGDEDIIASFSDDMENSSIYWIKNDTAFVKMNEIADLGLLGGKYFIENEAMHTIIQGREVGNQFGQFKLEDDSLAFVSKAELPAAQSFDPGDLNHDGLVDFVYKSGDQLLINYWNGEAFLQDTLASNISGDIDFFIGDFDLDGLADILSTTAVADESLSVFYKNDGAEGFVADSAFFDLNDGSICIAADINDDGDLDVLRLSSEIDSISFFVQINQTSISNKGPEPVYIYPPLTVYNETILSWQLTGDDHTDTLAISYELFIEREASANYHTMPGYDIDTSTRDGFRKVVGHGHQWFDTQFTANSLENGRYSWGVIGVDNAYHASSDIGSCMGGPCVGYYTVLNCFDLIVEDTSMCFNSTLTIDLDRGTDSIDWYSVKQGFLERSPTLNFQVLESDTIFALQFPRIPCDEETDLCMLNYSIAIQVEKREVELLGEMSICPGIDNMVAVEGVWDSVRWWYDDSIVAGGPKITLDSVPEIPIIAEAFDSLHCSVFDTLQIDTPERAFDPESLAKTIVACQGQATEIDVFSEINTVNLQFNWQPQELFDGPNLPNPSITASQEMQISVLVSESNCFVDTLIFDLDIAPLPTITTNGDQEIFRSEKVFLEASGAAGYLWSPEAGLQSPDSQNTWAEPTITTNYSVRGRSEQDCYADADLNVLAKSSVYIPDLFSPNGDGRNDFLHVYGEGVLQVSFKIYDERGALIAEIDESSNKQGWDGTLSGNELPSGTYFWTVSGEFSDGQPITYLGKNKGTIRMVR
jgi:gliding motility-associated-like protein